MPIELEKTQGVKFPLQLLNHLEAVVVFGQLQEGLAVKEVQVPSALVIFIHA